jgi:hypothetical protein
MRAHQFYAGARFCGRAALLACQAACSLLIAACTQPTIPLPEGATPFDPPPHFAFWWSLTEQCSGLTGRYQDVRWYSVPTANLTVQNGDTLAGEWFPGTNQIVISQRGLQDPTLVRHEMLHALLNRSAHPRALFYARCNGYVSCVGQCARDVAPIDTIPQPGAMDIDPSQLRLRLALVPDAIADSINEGWFAIVLSVTNPFTHPVRMRLAKIPGNPDFVETEGYGLMQGDPTVALAYVDGGSFYRFENDSLGFDGGETRNLVIDESSQKLRLRSGMRYSVRGWFKSIRRL